MMGVLVNVSLAQKIPKDSTQLIKSGSLTSVTKFLTHTHTHTPNATTNILTCFFSVRLYQNLEVACHISDFRCSAIGF